MAPEQKQVFPKNLKYLRGKAGKSQADIALQVKKRSTAVSSWENGLSQPSLDDLAIISDYFGVYIGDLIGKDMEHVHLNIEPKAAENSKNVHLNVHPTVHLTAKKGAKTDVLKGDQKDFSNTMPKVITIDTSGEENAVFVPVKARAGYLTGYGDPEFIKHLPVYKIPGTRHRTYRIFEVKGNSMFNTLSDHDRVNAYWVSISEVRDDRVYVILTKEEGIVIKRVFNRYQEGKIICTSDNNHRGEYPPIIIDVYDVLEVWEVEEKASKQLGRPGEIYKRVADQEARITLLEDKFKKLNL